MTATRQLPQPDPSLSDRLMLPMLHNRKSEDVEEPGLPDDFHFYQPELLLLTFKPAYWEPDTVFSASDLNLYYDFRHPAWYKRPDWFALKGTPQLYDEGDMRLNCLIWQEQVKPFVVVELLSPGTEDEDLGKTIRRSAEEPPSKWEVYEQILRVPYYIVFNRYMGELQGFRLVAGQYEPAPLIEGRLPVPSLGLSLGVWQGSYQNINRLWLRWLTESGELIPTPSEQATAARQQAAAVQQRAICAEQRAERLAAKLRELNIDPNELL